MHPQMQDLDVEEGWVLLMNQHFKLIEAKRISFGGFTETAIDVRVILREAILKTPPYLPSATTTPAATPYQAEPTTN